MIFLLSKYTGHTLQIDGKGIEREAGFLGLPVFQSCCSAGGRASFFSGSTAHLSSAHGQAWVPWAAVHWHMGCEAPGDHTCSVVPDKWFQVLKCEEIRGLMSQPMLQRPGTSSGS